jgi:hypothetical protein
MKANNQRKILFLAAALVVLMVATGFYLYHLPPKDVRSMPAEKIEATALYEAYLKDTLTAQQHYGGRGVEVTGLINEVTRNQQGESIVLMTTNVPGAYINCTFEEKGISLPLTGLIHVKGVCGGIGEGDAELGIKGDVYLTRCIVIK